MVPFSCTVVQFFWNLLYSMEYCQWTVLEAASYYFPLTLKYFQIQQYLKIFGTPTPLSPWFSWRCSRIILLVQVSTNRNISSSIWFINQWYPTTSFEITFCKNCIRSEILIHPCIFYPNKLCMYNTTKPKMIHTNHKIDNGI